MVYSRFRAGLYRPASYSLGAGEIDLSREGPGLIRRARWWVRRASGQLDHIRDTIIPQLLQTTIDHELNRLLMRLDQTGYAFQGRLALAGLGIGKADRLTGTREAVADLLVDYAKVARHLEVNYLA